MTKSSDPAGVIPPRLPRLSGGEVNSEYIDMLISALEATFDVVFSERQRTISALSLSNLASTGANLRDDTVFEDGGILKIVRTGDVYAASFVATMSVGTVTVSTP